METLWADVRYAVRQLVRRPVFAGVAIATLAVGIGANTAIFSLVYGVLLAPLPVAEDHRVAWLGGRSEAGFDISVSIPNYDSWATRNDVFEAIGAQRIQSFILPGDRPERIVGTQVLGGYFDVVGQPPVVGRTIRSDETRRGAARLAVISEGLWQRRFDRDPGLVGASLVLSGEAFTVIGVMPDAFRFRDTDVWVPMGVDDTLPWEARGNSPGMYAMARLRPGVTFDQAGADMERVGAAVRADTGWTGMPVVTPLREVFVGDLRPALLVLFGAVGFTLLLACVNLANLLVARSDARRQEFAVRLSLGAGRGRLVRQLLTESVVTALAGGVAGIVVAHWMVDTLVAELPPGVVGMASIAVDGPVLGFTAVVSVVTGIVFGLLPALRSARATLHDSLKSGARGVASAHTRMRNGLVVGELALALVLLAGAGLLFQSLVRLQAVDPGFESDGIATMWVSLPDTEYADTASWTRFFNELTPRLGALPGVSAAAVSNLIPLATGGSESGSVPDNRAVTVDTLASCLFNTVSDAYFDTMGIPLLRGRAFDGRDTTDSALVAVVDESMAEAFWPGEDPIGRRVAFEFDGDRENPVPRWREVVGVVGHVRHYELRERSRIQLYVPVAQPPSYYDSRRRPMALLVRSAGDPTAAVAAVRDVVSALDPNLPVYSVRTMDEILVEEVGTDRLLSGVTSTFALVALLMAAIGIYGTIAFAVNQRAREIGVRMALGARAGDVVGMVVRGAVVLIGLGLVCGLAATVALSRTIERVLYNVAPADPATLAALALVLALVAMVASYIPARRAARVDPIIALRAE